MIPSCFTLDWAGWEPVCFEPDNTRICRELANGKWAKVSHFPKEEDPFWLFIKGPGSPSICRGPEEFVLDVINAYAERNGGWAK